jgi:flavin-dependent dehydrogenase
MNIQTDILIIGGGLAGLTAALHLQQKGLEVLLIEKNGYPHHKVCGEYLSNEVLPYLKWLDADLADLSPVQIKRLQFSSLNGSGMISDLPLGGIGISRYTLDHELYRKFIAKGGTVIRDQVLSIQYNRESFVTQIASLETIQSKHVIGAYGKRSGIDLKLKRPFMQVRSPFLAVKSHYTGSFEKDLVALHNFRGGYCGVSRVEDQKINICYLADYKTFSLYKSVHAYQENVLYKNKELKQVFENSQPLFEKPLVISQLSFGTKEAVVDHILMIGDTAGLIHPLCGNGMAMAIHSAKICAELLLEFSAGKIRTRPELEEKYRIEWNYNFKNRLKTGTVLSGLLQKKSLSELVLKTMIHIPGILPAIIRKTHGKTLTVNTE